MCHFKQLPIKTVDYLTHFLWVSQYIMLNRKLLYWKDCERLGILKLKDILNKDK